MRREGLGPMLLLETVKHKEMIKISKFKREFYRPLI